MVGDAKEWTADIVEKAKELKVRFSAVIVCKWYG